MLYLACTSAHLWSLGQEGRSVPGLPHRFMTRRSQVTNWLAGWRADGLTELERYKHEQAGYPHYTRNCARMPLSAEYALANSM